MSTSVIIEKKSIEELNECIVKAMDKVGVQKEMNLSRYIPGNGKSGYLHHLAFGRLKKSNPAMLQQLIREHILKKEKPEFISFTTRPTMRVKRTVELTLKKTMINQLLDALKISKIEGSEELIALLSSHQSIGQIQKLMIEMVKAKQVDVDLWETYKKLVEEERSSSDSTINTKNGSNV